MNGCEIGISARKVLKKSVVTATKEALCVGVCWMEEK